MLHICVFLGFKKNNYKLACYNCSGREERKMLRTITIGSHIQVQGLLVRTLANGKVIISVGEQEFEGKPITRLN